MLVNVISLQGMACCLLSLSIYNNCLACNVVKLILHWCSFSDLVLEETSLSETVNLCLQYVF